jgi:putative ABC transport system permease protein
MRNSWLDLRYAIKSMLRAPSFAAVGVFSLALGIGTNAAVFTVFNAVLLRPLPYHDPGRLMAVFETNPKQGANRVSVCPPDFLDWQRELKSLQQPAAYRQWEPNLTGVEVPERLTGMRVTGDFFAVLGVAPVAGRVLMAEDERANARAVVVSHALWRRQFGAAVNAVGRSIVLNGEAHAVVGIMPDSFQFPDRAIEIWGPLNLDRERNDRAEHSLRVVARLRAGAAIGGARAELATLMARQGPENEGDSGDLMPLRDWYVGATSRRMLWGLLGAVALLLLASCANVANLALARGTGRAREMMIRTAIGATRRRLIAQLVIESLVLSTVAGLAGLLFAMWTADVLVASLPQTSVYRMAPLTTDWRVLLYTFAVAAVAGLLFGIAPALRYSQARYSLGHLTTRMAAGPLQRLLLVAQTALAVTLIAGAGLLARSFVNLWTIEPGFSSENVTVARISVPSSLPESRQIEFFSTVARHLEGNPLVAAAGAVTFLPLSGEGSGGFITFEGREAMSAESGSRPGASRLIVTPGYFNALKLTLKEGRFLNDQDGTNSPWVVVVNESMARRYWPGESPVGKRIKRGTPTAKFPWLTVVGVVGDVRQMNLVDPVGSMIYLPLTQFPSSSMSLTVRSTVSAGAATALIRTAVRAADADQPIAWIRPLDELVFGSLGGRWLPLLWMSVFAGLSLVLAAIGVYGVVSYVVEQRRREFGIRMALGAARADLVRLAIRHGLTPALAGSAIGLVAAAILARVNSTLFAGVAPFDGPAFLSAAAILAVIALAASYPPARRIASEDAAIALRSE